MKRGIGIEYLRVELINRFDGILYAAKMDVMLDLVAEYHRLLLLEGLKVSFLRELVCGGRVAFCGEVVENEDIDVTFGGFHFVSPSFEGMLRGSRG